MRSLYSTLLFLAAATPLLADEQSDCLAQASPTNGVVFWTGDEVPLDKVDSSGNIMPGSNGTTKGCMVLGGYVGQVRIGEQPDNPQKDSRTMLETNPIASWPSYDVSYIAGFSHTLTCQDTVQKTLTGDSTDLWNVTGAVCEEKNGYTCVGPVGAYGIHLSEMSPTSCWNCNPPNTFFAPVAGAAYTYPDDNGAVISGSSNAIHCCVGAKCNMKNPKAGTTKAGTCTCNQGLDKKRDVEEPESKPKSKRHVHSHGKHKVRGLNEVV